MYRELNNTFFNYNEFSRSKEIKLLKKYFPIGIEVTLFDNGEELEPPRKSNIISLNSNDDKTVVIGYDLESKDSIGNKYVPGLIIKDLPKDESYIINGKSVHPGYVFYTKCDKRDSLINSLLKT